MSLYMLSDLVELYLPQIFDIGQLIFDDLHLVYRGERTLSSLLALLRSSEAMLDWPSLKKLAIFPVLSACLTLRRLMDCLVSRIIFFCGVFTIIIGYFRVDSKFT